MTFKKNKIQYITLITLCLVSCLAVVLIFQNCANTELDTTRVTPPIIMISKAVIEICLDDPKLAGYTLQSFVTINPAVKFYKGKQVKDSDFDGLPDELEKEIGTNPFKARTIDMLDSVCFLLNRQTCQKIDIGLTTVCDSSKSVGFGFSECDLHALGLQNNIRAGLDSDGDGMIDYLELVNGTLISENDSTADPDNDGQTNLNEILDGSDPNFADRPLIAEASYQTTLHRVQHSSGASGSSGAAPASGGTGGAPVPKLACNGNEHWLAKVDNMLWVKSESQIVDTLLGNTTLSSPLNLSIRKDHGIFLFIIKLKATGAISSSPNFYDKVFVKVFDKELPLKVGQEKPFEFFLSTGKNDFTEATR